MNFLFLDHRCRKAASDIFHLSFLTNLLDFWGCCLALTQVDVDLLCGGSGLLVLEGLEGVEADGRIFRERMLGRIEDR
jgi:hypothetical protein